MERIDFRKTSKEYVQNSKLKGALASATDRFRSQREESIGLISDWDELRERGRAIKEHTIANLDRYLEELESSITALGGQVHWARDSSEATDIVKEIAKRNNVHNVVKSKSMATEEIELNKALESAGIRVVETDLGEYIIQLAGEKPSHIIAPAIHKTKEDISRLFVDKLKTPYYDDPEDLTKFAREKLREEFINADMGVSGANFAVSETGTIVIVENEGNARLTTTLPRVHVAVMGIEKVIPRFADLDLFLNLLIRSATGQKLSSYVSFITGPKSSGHLDGPEELHLVLLDNGRTDIIANENTRESLYCLRCGACLNICPVYRQVGGHAYGGVYSGPIGAIITPQLMGLHMASDLPFASSLCGACKDVCPVEIDIPRVLIELRRMSNNLKRRGGLLKNGFSEGAAYKIWAFLMTHSSAYRAFSKMGYYLSRIFTKKDSRGEESISGLPYPFSKWTDFRDFPALPEKTFREVWRDGLRDEIPDEK